MAWLQAAAAVVSIVGNLKAGDAAKRQGLEQQQAAEYEAEQNRVNAMQAVASAQRDAAEERRQGDLVQSRAIALAAASGGGVTDPGVVTLLSRNAGETAYRSAVALYKGEDDARRLRAGADAASYSGKAAAQAGRERQSAYNTRAFGDMLGGAKSLYDNYWTQSPAPVYDATPTPVRR